MTHCTLCVYHVYVAITFVSVGTSLPDLFASKVAATKEKYADNAVGNVTGSNSVNVFLGLGLPWLVAALYHEQVLVSIIQHCFQNSPYLSNICKSAYFRKLIFIYSSKNKNNLNQSKCNVFYFN